MKAYDAVIVGGGHNGLVAAHYLREAGLSVLVLEQRQLVGGPCSDVEYFPGFRAAITNSPGSFEPKFVQDMRLEEFGLEFIRPDPSLVMPFPNGKVFIGWREKEKVVECIRSFSEKDATAYYRFFDTLNALAKKLGYSLFAPPPNIAEIFANLDTDEDRALFGKIVFGSIEELLDQYFESEEIKSCIAMLSIMSSLAGPSTPGTPYMLMQRPLSLASQTSEARAHDPRNQPMRGSTGLPKGGMGSIVAAMARSLQAAGVEIRCNAEVSAIVTRNGQAQGVVLSSGEEIRASNVLSNLNPKTTLLDLVEPGAIPADLAHRLETLRMRGNGFKIGLALNDIPRWSFAKDDEDARILAQSQFRIGPSIQYMETAYADAISGRWSSCPLLWGLTPSVTDPSLAPPGKHLMTISVFHAPYHLAEGNWETEKVKFGEHCIKVLTEYMPDLPKIIIGKRFWSPVDFEKEFGIIEGNASHGHMLPGHMFSQRPTEGLANYETPVRGLYLCGSGVWPGGYISGIPGYNGSQRVLADLGRNESESAERLLATGV